MFNSDLIRISRESFHRPRIQVQRFVQRLKRKGVRRDVRAGNSVPNSSFMFNSFDSCGRWTCSFARVRRKGCTKGIVKKKGRGSAGLSKVSTKIYLYYTSMRDDACKIRLCIKRRGVFTSLRNSAS